MADFDAPVVHVHSRGMEKHGRLNFYLPNVPTVLWRSGADFVGNICQATLKGDDFSAGTLHKHPDYGRWRIDEVEVAADDHGMKTQTMLQIVPLPITCMCERCEKERKRRKNRGG